MRSIGKDNRLWLDPDWITIVLASGWTHYSGPYNGCKMRRDMMGKIHFRGLAKNSGGGAVGVPATLPVGFIPLDTALVVTVGFPGSGSEVGMPCYIKGISDSNPGQLSIQYTGGVTSPNGYFSFGGIQPLQIS